MKLKVPTELKDISLDQVQQVLLIDQNEQIEPFAKRVHSVAILTRRSSAEIGLVALPDLNKIYDRLFAMINGLGSAPLTRKIKYRNREYGFIEDVRDMETGAFVDIDEMCKNDKYAANLHKIMAILYRPIDAEIGGRYRLKSYVKEDQREREERQKIFLNDMTFDIVRGAAGFFLLVTQRCLSISDDSFPRVRNLTPPTGIRGVGTTSYTPSPAGISQK